MYFITAKVSGWATMPTGAIPTKKVKIMPTTTIPTLMPTPTILTTCVNCGHSKKTKLGTKFDVGNFNFQLR
jgi:hypothetical protein